jgi:pimeloyl-ACP methyl ester carboxylesterase
MARFRPSLYDRFVTRCTSRPRLVLVHGSVVGGETTWGAQQALGDRFELVVPTRRGFPPGPDVDRVDFEDEAVWLEQFVAPGTHLVGHSYGGVIALFAGVRYADRLRSLCVIEPPAFGLAAGNPAADAFVEQAEALWERGPRDPAAFLRAFLAVVGSSAPAGTLSPALLQGARTLMVERYPWQAKPPLDELAATPFPKLVVSGAHSAAFDAVCDVLARKLRAERAVLPGAGHSVQRLGEPFNDLVAAFVERADARA